MTSEKVIKECIIAAEWDQKPVADAKALVSRPKRPRNSGSSQAAGSNKKKKSTEIRSCHFCKIKGHESNSCWFKFPEKRPAKKEQEQGKKKISFGAKNADTSSA